jgi:hypothetical protein
MERNGLRLAPILGDDPLAAVSHSQWSRHRCVQTVCRAVAVR